MKDINWYQRSSGNPRRFDDDYLIFQDYNNEGYGKLSLFVDDYGYDEIACDKVSVYESNNFSLFFCNETTHNCDTIIPKTIVDAVMHFSSKRYSVNNQLAADLLFMYDSVFSSFCLNGSLFVYYFDENKLCLDCYCLGYDDDYVCVCITPFNSFNVCYKFIREQHGCLDNTSQYLCTKLHNTVTSVRKRYMPKKRVRDRLVLTGENRPFKCSKRVYMLELTDVYLLCDIISTTRYVYETTDDNSFIYIMRFFDNFIRIQISDVVELDVITLSTVYTYLMPYDIKEHSGDTPPMYDETLKGLIDNIGVQTKIQFSKLVGCFNDNYTEENIEMVLTLLEKILSSYLTVFCDDKLIKVFSLLGLFFPGSISIAILDGIQQILCYFLGENWADITVKNYYEMIKSSLLVVNIAQANQYLKSFISSACALLTALLNPKLVLIGGKNLHNHLCKMIEQILAKFDIIGSVLEAVLYVVNAVSVFVESGSLSGFWSTNTIVDAIENDFAEVTKLHNSSINGDLRLDPDCSCNSKTQYEYEEQLESFVNNIKTVRKTLPPQYLSKVSMYLLKAEQYQQYAVTSTYAQSMRMAPACFVVSGRSAVNKSLVSSLIARQALISVNLPWTSKHCYNLNDKDKFQSGWKNYYTWIMVDDAANAIYEPGGFDLNNFLLKSVNNVPHNLLSAALESKGMFYNRTMVNILTTNNPELNLSSTSNFQSAVRRRINYVFDVQVKEQYRKPGSEPGTLQTCVDYDKVTDTSIVPDIWEITIYECEIGSSSPVANIKESLCSPISKPTDSDWKQKVVHEKLTIHETLAFVKKFMVSHVQKQERMLKVYDELDKKIVCNCGLLSCKGCNFSSDSITNLPIIDQSQVEEHSGTILSKLSDDLRKFRNSGIDTQIVKLSMEYAFADSCLGHIKDILQISFDNFVCTIFMSVIRNLFRYIRRVLCNPLVVLPTCMEGSRVDYYMHANTQLFKTLYSLDSIANTLSHARHLCNNGCDNTSYNIITPFTDVFLKGMAIRDRVNSLVYNWFHGYDKEILLKMVLDKIISRTQGYRKLQSKTDLFMKDTVNPLVLAYVFCRYIIPNYFSRFYNIEQYGNLTVSEIASLDKEQYNWKDNFPSLFCAPLSGNIQSKEHLLNYVKGITCYVSCLGKETRAIALDCEHILLNFHFIRVLRSLSVAPEVEMSLVFSEVDNQRTGNSVINKIINISKDSNSCYFNPSKDFCVIKVRTRGIVAGVIDRFTDEVLIGTHAGRLCYKSSTGNFETTQISAITYNANCTNNAELGITFPGYHYFGDVRKGLCGSVIISETFNRAIILGIHAGGLDESLVPNSVNRLGVGIHITKSDILFALSSLMSTGIIAHSSTIIQDEEFNIDQFGKMLYSPEFHKNTCLKTLPDNCSRVIPLGSLSDRVHIKNIIFKTKICDDVRAQFNVLDDWTCPSLKGLSNDKSFHFKQFIHKVDDGCKIPLDALNWAINDYEKSLTDVIDSNITYWSKEIRVLTDDEIVNGIQSLKYLNGMPMSTSAGKYLSGKKSKYATLEDGKWILHKFVWDEYYVHEQKWKQGIRTWHLTDAFPKVEPTKVSSGLKQRTIFNPGIILQMLCRKLTLTLSRLIYTQCEASECAVGINPHCTRWDKLFKRLNKFKNGRWIALDFSAFDLSCNDVIFDRVFDILIRILIRCGYSVDDITMVRVLKRVLLYNVINLNGDLVQIPGIITSGINLTSMLGSIVNSIYMRCAFYDIFKDRQNILSRGFREYVSLATFGDDSVGQVSNITKKFNVDNIISTLGKFNIKATNCHKDGRSVKFMKLTDVDFLKRKFKYDYEFELVVAPLSLTSIYKSLCYVKQSVMSVDAVTAVNVDTALLEMKFHGRNAYETFRAKITNIARKHGIDHHCFLLNKTFDDQLLAWRGEFNNSKSPSFVSTVVSMFLRHINKLEEHCCDQLVTDMFRHDATYILGFGHDLQCQNKNDCISVANKNYKNIGDPDNTFKFVSQYSRGCGDVLDVSQHIIEHSSQIVNEKELLVKFSQLKTDEILDISNDHYTHIQDNDLSISDFLARPVVIGTFNVGTTSTYYSIDPWAQLLSNPRISNRLTNVKLFSGNVHMKIMINGNSFYYGLIMASFRPMQGMDQLGDYNFGVAGTLCSMSQLPHIIIDPCTSKGGEMILPFTYHDSYLDLTDPYQGMGEVIFRSINTLRMSNANILATSVLTVTITAWFENVKVAGPTNVDMNLISPQSGNVENGDPKGPISKVATNVANKLHKLSLIPVIGETVLPAEQALRIGAEICDVFGWSKPIVSQDPCPVALMPCSSNCNSIGTFTGFKLSLDKKNNVTPSTSTFSCTNQDELAITYICSKPSYVGKFTWGRNVVRGTLLNVTPVVPTMAMYDSATQFYFPSAIGGAAMLFNYFKGTIKFKFQVVSSAFHRGRLLVIYDPVAVNSSPEMNTTYASIIDIASDKEFEIAIANHNRTEWVPMNSAYFQAINSSPLVKADAIYGAISIYVLNEMVVPNEDATISCDVDINVWISGGDDFQLAKPGSNYVNYIREQSGEVADPVSTTTQLVMEADNESYDSNRMFMGETVKSLRPLLKRTVPYMTIGFPSGSTADYIVLNQGPYNLRTGTNTAGIHTAKVGASTVSYNYTFNTPEMYISSAFLGKRGSMRYKIMEFVQTSTSTSTRVYDNASNIIITGLTNTTADSLQLNSLTQVAHQHGPSYMGMLVEQLFYGVEGIEVFKPSSCSVHEIEVPYYSSKLYLPARQFSIVEYYDSYPVLTVAWFRNAGNCDGMYMSLLLMTSVGDDYNLGFFVGWPKVKFVTSRPGPV